MKGYLPIAEHGVIGDLRTVALVGTDGCIDWFCSPHFDSPSVFGSILDSERGGHYSIAPLDEGRTSKQLYIPDTNVLITRFLTPRGVCEVEDFMPVAGHADSLHTGAILRRIVGVRGEMALRMEIEPRFDYARASHEVRHYPDGIVFASPSLALSFTGAPTIERTDHGAFSEFTISEGEQLTLILEPVDDGEAPRPRPPAFGEQVFAETIDYWRRWIAQSRYKGRWREMVHRSALALKLLTFQPTGAIVAAPTTSLPEQIGGERNWDYRYTWIRDAAFTLYALLRLGFTEEAEAFSGFLRGRIFALDGPTHGPLQIMYGIDGRTELPELTLEHLEGYRGSAPVRIGNDAADQLQLDIYGELIDSMYLFNKFGRPIFHEGWDAIARLVDWVCENWDQADEGIWETRGGRQDFTYSRVMSWVSIERAIRIANQRGLPAELPRWHAARDAIYHQVMSRGWHEERGAFVQHYDTDVLGCLHPDHAAGQVHCADGSEVDLDARRDQQRARLRLAGVSLQRRGVA